VIVSLESREGKPTAEELLSSPIICSFRPWKGRFSELLALILPLAEARLLAS
jgi:hypothetical protein